MIKIAVTAKLLVKWLIDSILQWVIAKRKLKRDAGNRQRPISASVSLGSLIVE